MKKHLILGFLMGMTYFTLEGFWKGWTNIAMLFIGGLGYSYTRGNLYGQICATLCIPMDSHLFSAYIWLDDWLSGNSMEKTHSTEFEIFIWNSLPHNSVQIFYLKTRL